MSSGWIGLAIAGLCYLFTAYGYARQHRWPMVAVFIGYGLTNVAFIIDMITWKGIK